MPLNGKVGGVMRELKLPLRAKVAGTVRELSSVYGKVGGVNKLLTVSKPSVPSITVYTPYKNQIDLYVNAGVNNGGAALTSCEVRLGGVTKTGSVGSVIGFGALSANTTYYADARVFNGSLWSDYCSAVSITTDREKTVPSAPRWLESRNVSENSLTLYWNMPSDDGGEPCRYYVYKNSSYIGETGSESYSVSGLNSSTSYSFYVTAYNGVGEGAASNTISCTTAAPPQPTSLPSYLSVSGVLYNTQISVSDYEVSLYPGENHYTGGTEETVGFITSTGSSCYLPAGTELRVCFDGFNSSDSVWWYDCTGTTTNGSGYIGIILSSPVSKSYKSSFVEVSLPTERGMAGSYKITIDGTAIYLQHY